MPESESSSSGEESCTDGDGKVAKQQKRKTKHKISLSNYEREFKRDLSDPEECKRLHIKRLPEANKSSCEDDKKNKAQVFPIEVSSKFEYKDAISLLISTPTELLSTEVDPDLIKPDTVFVYKVYKNKKGMYWRDDNKPWKSIKSHDYPYGEPKIHSLISSYKSGRRREYWATGFNLKEYQAWVPRRVVVHYDGDCVFSNATREGKRKQYQKVLEELQVPATDGRTAHPEGKTDSNASRATKETAVQSVLRNDDHETNNHVSHVEEGETQEQQHCATIENTKTLVIDNVKQINSEESQMSELLNDNESEVQSPSSTIKDQNDSWIDRHQNEIMDVPEHSVMKDLDIQSRRHTSHHKLKVMADEVQKGVRGVQLQRKLVTSSLSRSQKMKTVPRNMKQIKNLQWRLKIKEFGDVDDLAQVFALCRKNNEIVTDCKGAPFVYVLQTHPSILQHIVALNGMKIPIQFYYDTTYKAGDSYASLLSMRHPMLEGSPMVRVGAIFHESRAQEHSHDPFFRMLKQRCPAINSPLNLIFTDRETAIRNSVRDMFDEVKQLYCFNHIKQNVLRWCKSKKVNAKETRKYVTDIKILLWSSSEEEYSNNLTKFTVPNVIEPIEVEPDEQNTWDVPCENVPEFDANEAAAIENEGFKWSQRFKMYYDRCLHDDMQRCSKYNTQNDGVFNILSGLTTNPAESVNHAFKLNRKFPTFTENVLALYQMQVLDAYKIQEACQGKLNSDWKLQESFFDASKKLPTIFVEDMDILHPEKIEPKLVPKPLEGPICNITRTIAENIVDSGGVHKIGRGWFSVRNLNGTRTTVNYPKGECDCHGGSRCMHLLAVNIDIHGDDKRFGFITNNRRKPLARYYKKSKSKTTGKKGPHLGKPAPVYYQPDKDPSHEANEMVNTISDLEEVADNDVIIDLESLQPSKKHGSAKVRQDDQELDLEELDKAQSRNSSDNESSVTASVFSSAIVQSCDKRLTPPDMKEDTDQTLLLRFESINLFITDIKSLIGYSQADRRNKFVSRNELWLTDNVIHAYLKLQLSDVPNVMYVEPVAAKSVMAGGTGKAYLRHWHLDHPDEVLQRAVFILHEVNHYRYLDVDLTNKVMRAADSLYNWVPSSSEKKIIAKWLEPYTPEDSGRWKTQILQCSKQKDQSSCGVYACAFASLLKTGDTTAITTSINPKQWRRKILKDLVGNCDISHDFYGKDMAREKCTQCENSGGKNEDWINCDRCGSWTHLQCLSNQQLAKKPFHCEKKEELFPP